MHISNFRGAVLLHFVGMLLPAKYVKDLNFAMDV